MQVKNNVNHIGVQSRSVEAEKIVAPRSANAVAPSAQDADTVHISSATLKATTMEAAKNSADIRVDKVEALQQAIAGGTYQIDSKRIAEGILKNETGFFNS